MVVRASREDRGETLLELVITMILMSFALLALLGGIGTSFRVTDIHRKQANAGVYVREFAEAIETEVAASPSGYDDCATVASYSGIYTIADSKYIAAVTAVAHWDGSSFTTTCVTDRGVQRVSLSVTTSDGSVVDTLDVVIRKPCRSTTDFPLDPPCV